MRNFILFLVIIWSLSNSVMAQIEIPKIFSSNMVLPRDIALTIEGTASPLDTLFITIADQKHTVKVDEKGKFIVTLNPLSPGGPFTFSFHGEKSKVLKNILVGDLWLCAGQSNMQYTPKMLNLKTVDTSRITQTNLRLCSIGTAIDYLPQNEVASTIWEEANPETISDFSAVGYYFGKKLVESQNIPVGLISSNMGATTIETWMSMGALKKLPQFDEVTRSVKEIGKDFATLEKGLKTFRKKWDKKYYLVGPGLAERWYSDEYDDSEWKTVDLPAFWEDFGYPNHDGSFWFRRTFDLDSTQLQKDLQLNLNQIDDYDITWVNGYKVGETFGKSNFRNYSVPKTYLRARGNTIAVRVFDVGGKGGLYTNAFWGNPLLVGKWKYKKGRKINTKKFPKPVVANGSMFSHPLLLYNGSIAPLEKIPISGVIWYQGESNENRGVEYEQLLEYLIKDWREHWENPTMPFLIVQLANYKKEDSIPGNSKWAEIRESQMNVTKLHNVDIATAIDIGDANDIHPKNKWEVGRRLALLALHYNYGEPLVKGPKYISQTIDGKTIKIKFNTYQGELKSTDKYGYLRGFSIAGEDGKFRWAKAYISDKNEVTVYLEGLNNPKYVRYAWSDNPGPLDLVNQIGLPAFPFRTDDFELSTSKEKYKYDLHAF